jgi:hypothetical protein
MDPWNHFFWLVLLSEAFLTSYSPSTLSVCDPQGSFGCVYKGMWHGKVVAVKIVNYPAAYLLQASSGGAAEGGQQAEAGAGSGAGVAARAGGRGGGRGGHTGPQLALMEAALAGHMQHPNVVQVSGDTAGARLLGLPHAVEPHAVESSVQWRPASVWTQQT